MMSPKQLYLLKLQQMYYQERPEDRRRLFIFWDGYSQHEDDDRAYALDGLCKIGLFCKIDSEYGIYEITQSGLDYEVIA